jgi:hypothetical protein
VTDQLNRSHADIEGEGEAENKSARCYRLYSRRMSGRRSRQVRFFMSPSQG